MKTTCDSCGLPIAIDLSGPKEIWLKLPKCQRTKPKPANVPKDDGYYFVRYQHCKHIISTEGSGYSTFSWHVEPENAYGWQIVHIDGGQVTFMGTDETGKFSERHQVIVDIKPLPSETWPKEE